jgi:hypothetical protein
MNKFENNQLHPYRKLAPAHEYLILLDYRQIITPMSREPNGTPDTDTHTHA